MDTSHRLRFRQRKQISSQTTCLTTAQPDQNAGVATPESLDASGGPQSQQQPHTLAQTCLTAHVLCGQQASLQLPTAEILHLLAALQQRLGIDPNNAELAINEVLASHADPQYTDWKIIIMDNTAWQLNPTDPGSLTFSAQDWVEENLTKSGMYC